MLLPNIWETMLSGTKAVHCDDVGIFGLRANFLFTQDFVLICCLFSLLGYSEEEVEEIIEEEEEEGLLEYDDAWWAGTSVSFVLD